MSRFGDLLAGRTSPAPVPAPEPVVEEAPAPAPEPVVEEASVPEPVVEETPVRPNSYKTSKKSHRRK